MSEIWTIMTATLGVPPRPDDAFTWEYLDGDGKFRSWSGTPLEFYKAFTSRQYPVGGVYLNLRVSFSAEFFFQPTDSFSIINDPRNEYKKLYTVDKLGNIWGGREVLCKSILV